MCFTQFTPLLWLITVQNMNKINTCLLRYHNKHNMYEHGTVPNAMLHTSLTHGSGLVYQVWTKSTHSVLKYHNKQHTTFMKKCHNYSNMAQSPILFCVHQHPMVPDHSATYNSLVECMRVERWTEKQKVGQKVWWTGPILTIADSTMQWPWFISGSLLSLSYLIIWTCISESNI